MASDRIKHLFADVEEFKSLLNDATTEAASEWAIQFCKDMNDRFDKYGQEAFITEPQLKKLREIAEAEHER